MSAVDIEQMSADGTVALVSVVVFDGERMMPKVVLCFGSVRDSLAPTIHLANPSLLLANPSLLLANPSLPSSRPPLLFARPLTTVSQASQVWPRHVGPCWAVSALCWTVAFHFRPCRREMSVASAEASLSI